MPWNPFKRTQPPSFDARLAGLSLRLSTAQRSLSNKRQTQSRLQARFTLRLFALWMTYTLLFLLGRSLHLTLIHAHPLALALPVLLGPLPILLGRRALQAYFHRTITAQGPSLPSLSLSPPLALTPDRINTGRAVCREAVDRGRDQAHAELQ